MSLSLFPKVRPGLSGPYVSRKLLRRAQVESIDALTRHKRHIEVTFAKQLRSKTATFDLKHACNMIRNAQMAHTDSVFGLCDGETIWISDGKMHYKNIVGTLIHEALHGTVRVPKRDELTEDEEHDAMIALGDWEAKGAVN